jgi:uncharacterized protein (DUF1800 family)
MHPSLESWRPGADGPWDRAAAAHLLRRAGFGPRPGDIERALERGFDATIAEALVPPGHDARELSEIETLLPVGKIEHLQAWWMSLILGDGAPIVERMALVWHDHFATSSDKVDDVVLMHRQNRIFREQGLGDFRAMLHALAKDPAMLVWLDGNENRRGTPNENFARELFELFALGLGNYTEHDIKEAARGLTGWGTDGRSFALRTAWHDDGEKTLFGRTDKFDGEAVVDWTLAQPACARFLARSLLQNFVSRAVAPEVEAELAGVLERNEWHVGRTLELVLRSKLFFAPESRNARIAGPVELVAMAVRALDARVAPAVAVRAAARMGQSLFRPPSVKGWDGGRTWIHAGSWLARHELMTQLAKADGRSEGTVQLDLQRLCGGAKDAGAACEAIVRALLPCGVDASYARPLSDAARGSPSLAHARQTVALLVLTSPEFSFI